MPLSASTLPTLRARGLSVPSYDRSRLRPRIAHIGVGGFHRSHLALYCHLLAERESDWGIRGLGLLPRDAAMAEALRDQDHLYALTECGTEQSSTTIIGSIIDYRMASDGGEPAIDAIADPETAIVSMTVTEAGYGDDTASRRTFDLVAAGLDRRHRSGAGPLTILSCDNLPGNGAIARGRILEAVSRSGSRCRSWVEERCTFPRSMVDRITPVTTDADRQHLESRYGLIDRWPVVAEPFRQWALEDDFAAGRPTFEDVDVVFTHDVHAWELYKLRFLNAGHTALAYLSALARITYVDEAIADPHIGPFVSALLLEEAAPTIKPIPGHPRETYVATVLDRFANTGVRDQISRICTDGSSKISTFLVPIITSQIALHGPIWLSALALAGWAHYLSDLPEAAQARDARGEASRHLARAALTDPVRFLRGNQVLPDVMTADPAFRAAFEGSHQLITDLGPRKAVASVLGSIG